MQNSGSVPASRKSKIMSLALTALIAVLVMIMAYVLFSGKPDIESLAVLPFVNTSEDPDANYLSDGVTASLINRLSELSELKVMSRHSVVRFKDQDRDPLAAGRQLEVESVLAGQMGIRGDDLVVTVELLNVKDGRQLWGDRFERSRKEILSVEHEIVERISGKLKKRYSRNEDQQKAIGADPMAYDLYLRGRYIMLGTSDDGPARAQEYFRQAIEKDPRLAVAYAGLGASYVTQTWLNSRKSGEMIPLAKAALDKAMELDDRLSEAYVLKGEIALVYEWDWAAARSAYQKAIELNPGSDLAHREYSSFLLVMGEIEEAIAESRLAQSLDPLSVYATHQMGYNLLAAGRLAEAATEFKKAIDLNPSWIWGNIKLGMSYAHMGEHEKALAALHRADELLAGKTPSPLAQSWMAEIAYLSGETERAKATLANLENMAKTTYVDPFTMAGLYFVTGDSDKFFSELERGMETRAPHMFTLLLHSKYFWKSAAGDPRYKSFLERLKFPGI